MRHYPIFLDTAGRKFVVVGGGEAALAKLRLLLKTEAAIEVFAPEPAPGLRRLHGAGRVRLHPRLPGASDLDGAAAVFAASGRQSEDRRTARMASAAGVLVNVVDDLGASDFITPAIVDRDPVTVAIGTEGTAPVLARRIKADLEDMLSPRLGALARAAARVRSAVARHPRGAWRRRFWTAFFSGAGERAIAERGDAALSKLVAEHATRAREDAGRTGRVLLVGAGPGDPELLTLKARRALREADMVLYDRLADPRVLELARREATLAEVGKIPAADFQAGERSWKQSEINRFVIEQARAGHTVVRLKSGDPMVFGRADEELDALEAAGIECEVLSGVTSAAAAAASMRTSLTRRGRNSSFSILTAQDTKGYAEHDWRALARPGAAFAVYMGVRAARFVQGRLMLHGASPNTPVSVVENASRDNERVLAGTLAGLQALFHAHDVKGPAVMFIGLDARAATARMRDGAPEPRLRPNSMEVAIR